MNPIESVRENLDYVASSVRRNERAPGEAAIYFLWAVLVPIGFALPDFAPRLAGPYDWDAEGHGVVRAVRIHHVLVASEAGADRVDVEDRQR